MIVKCEFNNGELQAIQSALYSRIKQLMTLAERAKAKNEAFDFEKNDNKIQFAMELHSKIELMLLKESVHQCGR